MTWLLVMVKLLSIVNKHDRNKGNSVGYDKVNSDFVRMSGIPHA
jgi:hypothetical protein